MYVMIVEIVEVIGTNNRGIVANMQIPHYGNTGFGTLLCMLLQRYVTFTIVPKSGPTGLC